MGVSYRDNIARFRVNICSVRNYLFSGDGYEQAVGSENSLWVSFGDDLSLQQDIVQYGGDGESAIFAAKMRNDGYIFTAGKKALRGLRGVTEDLHNASLFMIDPQTGESVLGGAEFGQDESNEVVWGLDFDKDGTVLAVGYTERDAVEGKAGYPLHKGARRLLYRSTIRASEKSLLWFPKKEGR